MTRRREKLGTHAPRGLTTAKTISPFPFHIFHRFQEVSVSIRLARPQVRDIKIMVNRCNEEDITDIFSPLHINLDLLVVTVGPNGPAVWMAFGSSKGLALFSVNTVLISICRIFGLFIVELFYS